MIRGRMAMAVLAVLTPIAADGARIQGTIRYQSYGLGASGYTAPTDRPARHITVEIVDTDGIDNVVATTSTNSSGVFDVSVPDIPIGETVGIRFYAATAAATVKASSGSATYSWTTTGDPDLVVSDPFNVGLMRVQNADAAGALNILDVFVAGYQHADTRSTQTIPSVTARWEEGDVPSCGTSCYGNDTIYVLSQGTSGSDDNDQFDDVVLLHEYGHHLQDNLSCNGSPGGSHSQCESGQDERLAWSEGFGNYFGVLVASLDASVDDYGANYVDNVGVYGDSAVNLISNLESNTGCSSSTYGADSEDAVSRILWDLQDSASDSPDAYQRSEADAFKVIDVDMQSASVCDLEAFIDGWCSRFGSDVALYEPIFERFGVSVQPPCPADASVNISANDATATESGPTTGQFTITRSGGSGVAASLSVSFSRSGTATNATDYAAISSPVTIPAGSSSKTITVTPVNDSTVESDETVVLTLNSGSGYTVGANATATVTIQSDDGAASNDNCSNAAQLQSGANCSFTAGNVRNAGPSGLAKPSCDGFSNPNMFDVWYRFSAVSASQVVTVDPDTSVGDPVVSVYGSCGGSAIGCAHGAGQGGTEMLTLTGLTPGSTYYVRVYDYGSIEPAGADADFRICVTGSASAACSYSIDPASASRSAAGDDGSIEVTSSPNGCTGGSWDASSNTSWLALTGTHSGSGPGVWTVPYSYTPNPGTSERQGTVTFDGASPSTFTLTQDGSSGCAAPSPPSVEAPASAANGSSYVVSWTATSPEGYYDYEEAKDPSFSPESIVAGGRGFIETSLTRSRAPAVQTTYYFRVRARNRCDGDDYWSDFSAVRTTVVAGKPPHTPTNLVAKGMTSTQVNLTWSPASYAQSYEIRRRGTVGHVATTTSPDWTDSGLTPGASYVYDVRSVAADGQMRSNYSTPDVATTIVLSDDPLVAQTTPIRATHVSELRTAVNAVRQAAGLSAATFTDGTLPGAGVKALHIQELRGALDAARSILGLPALSYTPLAAGSIIGAIDVMEIRSGVQ